MICGKYIWPAAALAGRYETMQQYLTTPRTRRQCGFTWLPPRAGGQQYQIDSRIRADSKQFANSHMKDLLCPYSVRLLWVHNLAPKHCPISRSWAEQGYCFPAL
jgi:hypothetical protein